jgi:hypothetical protein
VEAVPQPALDAQRQVLGTLLERKDDPLLRSQNENKYRMMICLYLANSFGSKTEQKTKFLEENKGQMASASLVAISGPQKNIDFRGPPLPMAIEMDLPASKSSSPSTI